MGLYHGTVVSHEGLYQISFDDANIGILNIKDIDLMVRKIIFLNPSMISFFQCEEPIEQILLIDKLKTMKFGGKNNQVKRNFFRQIEMVFCIGMFNQ